MSFEVYTPYHERFSKPGFVAMSSEGEVRFFNEDLKAVGINGHATVLVDMHTRRVAVRAPTADDPRLQVYRRDSARASRISMQGVFTQLGVKKWKGKRLAPVTRKDNLLIFAVD